MNATTFRERSGQTAALGGGVAMLLGALDPMEGSIVILAGSALMALGVWLRHAARQEIVYRLIVFALIGTGVGALWGLSAVGGFGGGSGRSWWWGLTILPYLIGWAAGLLGRNSPRWFLVGGVAVSVFYVALPMLMLLQARDRPLPTLVPALIVSALGALTLVGCVYRLWRKR